MHRAKYELIALQNFLNYWGLWTSIFLGIANISFLWWMYLVLVAKYLMQLLVLGWYKYAIDLI